MIIVMKTKIFCGLFFFFFVVSIPFASHGNTDKEYYIQAKQLAKKERTNRNYIKALELIKKVAKSAEENNWIDLKIDAYNDMGVIYCDLYDYDKAVEHFLNAYNTALKESDKKRELLLLNNIGAIYNSNKDYLKAKEYFEKSYKIAIYLNDSFRIGSSFSNLASISQITGDFELAETYINLSLIMLNNYKNTPEYIRSQIVKTDNLYLQKKYNKAELLGLSVWEQLQDADHFLKPHFLLVLSKIYQKKGNLEKAIDFAHEALQGKLNLEDCVEIYGQLSDLYKLKNSYLLALQYKDSVIMTIDSLYKINNKDYLESNLIRFELINSEKQLSDNKTKQKAERMFFFVVIISFFVLAMIFIWVLRIQSIRNKQRKIIAENGQKIVGLELEKEKNEKLLLEQQLKEKETLALLEQERLNNETKEKLLLEQQLKEEKTLALLKQERLNNETKEKLLLEQQLKEEKTLALLKQEQFNNEKLVLEQKLKEQETLALLQQKELNNEIDIKNRQLITKILLQSSRNALIEEIISTLSDISDKTINPILESVVRKLGTELKETDDWNVFFTYFERINPSFLSSLKEKHPDLTTHEIRLISYIYLDLETKEIASLLNITFDSCKKRKQRLAQKMNIITSELYRYLTNLT